MNFPQNPSNILVIRYGRLGDVVLMVSAIKALRRCFPSAHLSVLVDQRYCQILEMCSAVNTVIPVDRIGMRDGTLLAGIGGIFRLAEAVRKAHYDLVLDFQSFRETNLLAWYSRAKWRIGLKRKQPSYLPFCFNLDPILEDKSQHVASVFSSLVSPFGNSQQIDDFSLDLQLKDIHLAELFLENHQLFQNAFLVGMNLGAGAIERIWPAERFARLADMIWKEFGAAVILFCGPQEENYARRFSRIVSCSSHAVAQNLDLKTVAAIISRCQILISNDSGPMHIGPAVGVPTLGLFSLGYPEHYRPLGKYSRFLKRTPVTSIQIDEVFNQVRDMFFLLTGKRTMVPPKHNKIP